MKVSIKRVDVDIGSLALIKAVVEGARTERQMSRINDWCKEIGIGRRVAFNIWFLREEEFMMFYMRWHGADVGELFD